MKHLAIALLLALCLCTTAHADSKAQQIEFLLSQVRTTAGPLSGGKVYFYSAGTTNPKTVWLDRDKTITAANPYTLDANGTAQLYAEGLYKVVIKNSAGVTVYSRDNLAFIAFSATDTANSQTVGGYFPDTGTTGSTVAVRDGNGKLPGDILGNAATVTGGVYVTGDQTIGGAKTFSSPIVGSLTGNADTATEATHAATADLATTATNATKVGGWTPSQTPTAGQVPVFVATAARIDVPASQVFSGWWNKSDTGDVYIQSGTTTERISYVQANSSATPTVELKAGTTSLTVKSDGSATLAGGTVWHSGNDGPGSGLNADLLDGIDITDFIRTSTQPSGSHWVEVAGGYSTNAPGTYGVTIYNPSTIGHHLYMISAFTTSGKAATGYNSPTSENLITIYPGAVTNDRCGVVADWHGGGVSRTLYYKIWEWQ